MSWATFQEIGKAKRAADLSHTGIKVLIKDGIFYLFPDGHKMPVKSTICLKESTIAAWLQVLHTIRQERKVKHE